MIKFFKQIWVSSNRTPDTISHEEVNDYDFENEAFLEVLKKPDEVRLYFDVDELNDEEDYQQPLAWLSKVSEVFGPYSIGGYSNDRDFADKFGFRFIDGEQHYLSAHIVFYETKIKADELITITEHKYKSFVNHEVNEFVDHNVYKLSSRQLFRHVLSGKFYKPGDIGLMLDSDTRRS